ncbi:MAG: serine/threonine protein kinase [Planctomycetota bacterium]|nr:serine/threonine protein kinase [Planctomycetota bacterium]
MASQGRFPIEPERGEFTRYLDAIQQNEPQAARALFRWSTVQEHPESPDYASLLGVTLGNVAKIDLDPGRAGEARARLGQAVEWQGKALASNPANPTYRHYQASHMENLVAVARGQGDAEGAADAERRLAELRASDPATAALDAPLSVIHKGDQRPRDVAERLALAQRAYDKALHATAARLRAEALAVEPKLGGDRQAQHQYNAACAAALAGAGQGKDDPRPDEAASAKLRAQALGWLRAELSAWERVGPGNKELVAQTLTHRKADADLAGLRDEAGLAKLPEAERTAFQQFWKDVDQLRAKATKAESARP